MSVRIDKFIWCVRLSKTRSKATEKVKKGKVLLNGVQVKPSKEVQEGDEVGIRKHTSTFLYTVKDTLSNRVGAKLVENYIRDITPQEEIEKYKTFQAAQSSYRHHGTGKPSKKDRRAIASFLEWKNES